MLLLQRTWIRFPKLTWWFITISNSSSTGSNSLSWDSWTPGMHTLHIHANKTLIHTFLNLRNGRIPDNSSRLEHKKCSDCNEIDLSNVYSRYECNPGAKAWQFHLQADWVIVFLSFTSQVCFPLKGGFRSST